MKKLFTLALIATLSILCANAQEAQQTQEAKDIKGAIVVKKQPTQENATQIQRVEKVYGSIIIFVQGKCPFDKKEEK